MSTIRKTIGVLLIVFILKTLYACCSFDNDPVFYDVTGYRINTYQVDLEGDRINNWTRLEPSAEVNADSLLIYLEGDGERIAFNSIFPGLYACSPPIPRYIGLGELTSLEIVSDYDYDQDHPAGSLLNDLFEISAGDIFWPVPADTPYDGSEPIATPFVLHLILLKAPTLSSLQQFTIRITLSTGVAIEEKTEEIIIT